MCELNNVTNVEHRHVFFLASMQFSEKLPADIFLKKTDHFKNCTMTSLQNCVMHIKSKGQHV
jgi:hypothetical protein